MLSDKIKSIPNAVKAVKRLKRKSKKIVFTNGCFDILHAGHASYLSKARSLGDALIVGLNSDSSVKKIKGASRPVVPQRNRAILLSAMEAVSLIVIFNELTPLELIKKIRPDVLVKGGDWQKEDIVGSDFVESYGGKVRSLAYLKGLSTRGLIDKIRRLK